MAITIDPNYWAVLVAAIVGYILGAVWYSPVLFGRQWMKLMGINQKDSKTMHKTAWKGYVGMFITLLVMAYILAHFVAYTEATTFLLGAVTGFWIWLGFLATTMMGSIFWENKSFRLYLINVGHYLVVLLLMGGILAVWP